MSARNNQHLSEAGPAGSGSVQNRLVLVQSVCVVVRYFSPSSSMKTVTAAA